ncbi:MAG TPA: class I SAM-dependent methyltransferase [Caulobacteraceae bacterium]|jgi:predicted methyltransferase|nr:class I SAM-dependent methyltransferase [Caulobacteraceae bacterium]
MRTRLALAATAALTLAAGAVWAARTAGAASSAPVYVSAALANPNRGDDPGLDAKRKPLEVVSFTGVRPGAKVADLIPGHGYWSIIFSDVVGPKGHVYLVWPKEYESDDKQDVVSTGELVKKPGFGNMSVLHETAAAFSAPEKLDLVFTAQNYHDYPDKFMGPTDPMLLNRAVYRALKPGGVFIVVDHAAQPGSGMRDTETLHRIDGAIVKKQVTAAGFEFVGESNALRNPADDHKLLVFKKEIRGHTDQFIYKFRKPLKAK